MIDGNTAALSRHMADQDRAQAAWDSHEERARDHLEAEIMAHRPLDAWDQYCDDPTHYHGTMHAEMIQAIASCDFAKLGRLTMFAIGRAARDLVQEHEVADLVRKMENDR